jgi:hypothetical protein
MKSPDGKPKFGFDGKSLTRVSPTRRSSSSFSKPNVSPRSAELV